MNIYDPFCKYSCKYFILIVLVILSNSLSAQVTIGSAEEPNLGALLDLKENNNFGQNSKRGLLLPRVLLRNINSIAPILDNNEEIIKHTGLTVYNMTDNHVAQLCRGVYTWSGNNWNRLNTPCCYEIKNVLISNPSLVFDAGTTEEIQAIVIDPLDLNDPNLEYEWYLDDEVIQARSSNRSLSLTFTMAHDGKQISVKAFNLCSEALSVSETIYVVETCKELQDITINNSLQKEDFKFARGKSVIFYPTISPTDASGLTYEWTYGDEHPIEAIGISKVLDTFDNGTKIKLTVSNACSSITKEVTIEVYEVLCPYLDKDKIYVTESNNKTVHTFSLYELTNNYSKEKLDALGVTIQWYKKQKNNDATVDQTFVPIPGANESKFDFLTSEYFGEAGDVCNIGVIVTGADNIMDCPLNNSRSFSFKIISQNSTSGGSYQAEVIVDENAW